MNYPDDINCFDNDPRSPFYEGGTFECCLCENIREAEEMSDEDICIYCVDED